MARGDKALGIVFSKKSNYNIVGLDYDNTTLEEVTEDVKQLQHDHNLGDATVYRSSKGENGLNCYHAYFFGNDLDTHEKVVEIIKSSDIVDPKFKEFVEKRGYLRMRVRGGCKESIKYVKDIESDYETDEDLKKFFKVFHSQMA